MKKTLKKILAIMLIIVCFLCNNGYCKVVDVDGSEQKFYEENQIQIKVAGTISNVCFFINTISIFIVIPLMIIYKKIKNRKNQKESEKIFIKGLITFEVYALITTYLLNGIINIVYTGEYYSKLLLDYTYIIYSIISYIIAFFILKKAIKKSKLNEV